jgi:hypothetical protein
MLTMGKEAQSLLSLLICQLKLLQSRNQRNDAISRMARTSHSLCSAQARCIDDDTNCQTPSCDKNTPGYLLDLHDLLLKVLHLLIEHLLLLQRLLQLLLGSFVFCMKLLDTLFHEGLHNTVNAVLLHHLLTIVSCKRALT